MPIPFSKNTPIVITFDKKKETNGWLHLLVNEHDKGEEPIEQVYLTYCGPGNIKGPHMHEGKKCDRFYCVHGKATLVCRDEDTGKIFEFEMEEFDQKVIYVPPRVSHGIVSKEGAVLVSITTEGFKNNKKYNQVETFYDNYNWEQWL